MSLKNMANSVSSKRGTFTNSYPVIVNSIEPNRYIFEVNKLGGNYHNFPSQNINLKELNNRLENLIRKSGDQDGHRTRAKCFRTRWDLHTTDWAVQLIGDNAISMAKKNPLAGRTSPDGTSEEIEYGIRECWGLIYEQGQETKSHSHWPSTWAFVYNVRACSKCSPLILPSNGIHPNTTLYPTEGMLTIFPAWLNHEVPSQPCSHERIIIAGNLNVVWSRF